MAGYETYLAAAIGKKQVPVILVADKSKADYIITFPGEGVKQSSYFHDLLDKLPPPAVQIPRDGLPVSQASSRKAEKRFTRILPRQRADALNIAKRLIRP